MQHWSIWADLYTIHIQLTDFICYMLMVLYSWCGSDYIHISGYVTDYTLILRYNEHRSNRHHISTNSNCNGMWVELHPAKPSKSQYHTTQFDIDTSTWTSIGHRVDHNGIPQTNIFCVIYAHNPTHSPQRTEIENPMIFLSFSSHAGSRLGHRPVCTTVSD